MCRGCAARTDRDAAPEARKGPDAHRRPEEEEVQRRDARADPRVAPQAQAAPEVQAVEHRHR